MGTSTTSSSTSIDPSTTAAPTSTDADVTTSPGTGGATSDPGSTGTEESSTGAPPPSDGLGPWGYHVHELDIAAEAIVLADFDGDGHVDVFTQRELGGKSSTLQVHLGTGGGIEGVAFGAAPPNQLAFGRFPAAGDFDGALALDVVAFDDFAAVRIALGDAQAAHPESVESATDSDFPEFGVAVLDVDDDGLDDVMIPNGHSQGASLYTSDGAGGIAFASTVPQPACYFSGSAVGDFDADGFDDVASTGSCNAVPEVLVLVVHRGTGDGLAVDQTFAEGPMVLEGGDVVAVDVDDDGDLDLVTGTWADTKGLTVLVNDGGTFAPPELRSLAWDGAARTIVAARLEADAPVAFVVQDEDVGVAVIEQTVDTWSATPIELGGDVVGAADFDEDGRTDVAVLNAGMLAIWASGG